MKTILRIAICLCLLAGSADAGMGVVGMGGGVAAVAASAPQHVETVSYYGSGDTITKTVNAGNFVVVYAIWNDSDKTLSSVSDNATTPNTYVAMTKKVGTSSAVMVHGYYSNIATTKTTATITLTWVASPSYKKIIVSEFSGIASSPLDQEASGTSNTGTAATTANTGTISQANELLIACVGSYTGTNTWTPQADWTEPTNGEQTGAEIQYRVVSSAAAYAGAATQSGSTYWAMVIAAFKGS